VLASGAVGELPEDANEMVEIALRNTDRLTHMINEVLDIQKMEAGNVDLNLEWLSPEQLIEELVEENTAFADQRDVTLEIDCRTEETLICVDPHKFHRVLTNLLSNAVKFSPEGEHVDVVAEMADAETVRLAIRDRGPGIPEDFQDELFEPFTQADPARNRQQPGTGLGLHIARELTERMGGEIGFETSDEEGTKMFVNLPVGESSHHTCPEPPDRREQP
jgi:signal transduction histidine kinase